MSADLEGPAHAPQNPSAATGGTLSAIPVFCSILLPSCHVVGTLIAPPVTPVQNITRQVIKDGGGEGQVDKRSPWEASFTLHMAGKRLPTCDFAAFGRIAHRARHRSPATFFGATSFTHCDWGVVRNKRNPNLPRAFCRDFSLDLEWAGRIQRFQIREWGGVHTDVVRDSQRLLCVCFLQRINNRTPFALTAAGVSVLTTHHINCSQKIGRIRSTPGNPIPMHQNKEVQHLFCEGVVRFEQYTMNGPESHVI